MLANLPSSSDNTLNILNFEGAEEEGGIKFRFGIGSNLQGNYFDEKLIPLTPTCHFGTSPPLTTLPSTQHGDHVCLQGKVTGVVKRPPV